MSDAPAPDPPPAPPDPSRSARAALDETATRAPMHTRDQAPRSILQAQAWAYRWISSQSRIVFSLVIVILAIVAAVLFSSFRILQILFDGLDIVALIGLFLVNWLGNGGALVPIPGARFIGLVLVFNQALALPSWEVFGVAGAGMSLGLLSYYIAGARTAQSYAEGDSQGAEDLARETGMLDDDSVDFSPGAELDAKAVAAIAGVESEDPKPSAAASTSEPGSGEGRLRSRFRSGLLRAQARAKPVLEKRGTAGMFLLCLAPTPMGTAAAYLGGLMRFGFSRYLLASFAAKFMLTGIIVLAALVSSDTASAVDIPEVHIPVLDVTLFEDGPPSLPAVTQPTPSAEPVD